MPITSVGQTDTYKGEDVESISLGAGLFGWIYTQPTVTSQDNFVIIDAPLHGLIVGDLGKPVDQTGVLFDDTAVDKTAFGVLLEIIDPNTLKIAITGHVLTLPYALVDGGSGYDIIGDGRFLDWDLSAGIYKAEPEVDAEVFSPQIIALTRDLGTEFEAVVIGYGESN